MLFLFHLIYFINFFTHRCTFYGITEQQQSNKPANKLHVVIITVNTAKKKPAVNTCASYNLQKSTEC